MRYFVFPSFFKGCPNFAFVCCMPSFFVSLFSIDWFNSSTAFAAILIVELKFG
jgi:hypothetical protein